MKKSIQELSLFVFASFLLTSCSPKIPFTQAVRDKYKITEADVKSIQFYLSDAVILKRGEDLNREKGTDNGTLVIKSGKNLEQVVFKRNTACVVNQVVDNKKLTVNFEDGANKFLVFGSEGDRNGYYVLKALDWSTGNGKITYGDQTYFANGASQQTFLMFKMKSLRKVNVEEKVVKGKKL